MSAHDEPALSIVIPIYNEEGILHAAVVDLIERLASESAQQPLFSRYEILLSENGSRDGTVAVGKQLAERYPQVRIDSLGRPDYGAALRAGLLAASGDVVVNFDVDYYDLAFVADAVRAWSRENLGACQYGDVGAVVGATHPGEMALLRRLAPEVIFLVPGYGAQGGSAADTASAFDANGLGAIINSSRGIIASFRPDEPAWRDAVREATRNAIAELGAVAGYR